jgi:hypothetical protein
MLTLYERGQLVRENRVFRVLENPTRNPDHVMRVCFSGTGPPRIEFAKPKPMVRVMPKMFEGFALPKGD